MTTAVLHDHTSPVFASQSVHALFPTPVWIHALRADDAAEINRLIVAEVERIRERHPPLRPGGMMQSRGDLAGKPPFSALVPFITSAAAGALKFLRADDAVPRVTSMWLNVSARMTAHRSHTHPNNYLSGVYYAQVDERSNTLTLEDPRPQASVLRPHYRLATELNSSVTNLRVQPGWLVLFPAFLSHSVPPSDSELLRISVAFNVILDNFVEEIAPIGWEGNIAV